MKNYGTIGSFERNDKNKRVNSSLLYILYREKYFDIQEHYWPYIFVIWLHDRFLLTCVQLLCFNDASARQIKEEGSHLRERSLRTSSIIIHLLLSDLFVGALTNSGDKANVIGTECGINLQTEGIHALEDLTDTENEKNSVTEKSIKYV